MAAFSWDKCDTRLQATGHIEEICLVSQDGFLPVYFFVTDRFYD